MSRDSPISADFTYACAFQRVALLSSQAERELSARIDTKKKTDLITKIHSFFMYET